MFHVVLYEPEIPQNTGGVGRTCVALGARLHLIEPLGFQIDSARVRRAGLDYWPHLDLHIWPTWDACAAALGSRRMWLMTKHASRFYTDASVRFADEDVFVFGCESRGLPPSLHEQYADSRLLIPTPGPVRSLNLSVSVGVILYEAFRQLP